MTKIGKYHNHTLQTKPRHCEEEPQNTYSHEKVSMIRKYQNFTTQTNPRHCEEEPQNTNHHEKVSRLGNTTITQRRPTHGTVGKSHKTFKVTIHPLDNKSIATSSFFLFKMIAKLERTHSNAQQNKDNTAPPQPMGSTPNNGSITKEQPP